MFDNVGYSFDSIEDVLIFVDWLQENFEDAEEFEEYLVSRFPVIATSSGDETLAIIINPCMVMEDEEDGDIDDTFTEALFWDMIHHEYHHEDSNGPAIPDTN